VWQQNEVPYTNCLKDLLVRSVTASVLVLGDKAAYKLDNLWYGQALPHYHLRI
jgi:hypothetical protein